MPTYAYKCKNCDHQFDMRQRYNDDPLVDCPRCDGNVRRIISRVGLVFKGSGFYVTDNRNGTGNGSANGKGKKEASEEQKNKKETEVESSSVSKKGGTDAKAPPDAAAAT